MRHPLALTYIDYEQRAASDVDDPGGRSTFLFEGNLDAAVDVVRGYYNYHAVPTNARALNAFSR
jgi:hypothetical protein